MLGLMLTLVLLNLVTGFQCPDTAVCEENETCCQSPSGEYTCCPFPQGVCCEDHLHCCPEGMLCQMEDSKCSNVTHTLPWVERSPERQTSIAKSFRIISSSPAIEDDIMCPDKSYCPAEFSCLKLSNAYGCCPVAQGIVCLDRKHCCPKDHQCSTDSSTCVKEREPVTAVMCSDGKSECPAQTSCCEAADGGWGCCPMPRAICCEDKVHCCPEDSTCDVESLKCLSSTNQHKPMWAKLPARLRADWEDHQSAAVTPGMWSITNNATESWSTADTGNATESWSTADTGNATESWSTADTGNATVSWSTADTGNATVSSVASDHSVTSPSTGISEKGNACCESTDRETRCCPLLQAVCCEDHVHCCPLNTTCNLATQTCVQISMTVPMLEKIPVTNQESNETENQQGEPGEDVPGEDEPGEDEPKEDEPKEDEPREDEPREDEPKEDEPGEDEPGEDEPKEDEPGEDEPGEDEPKEDEPGEDEGEEEGEGNGRDEEEQVQEEDGVIWCDAHMACPEHSTCCFMNSVQTWGCCPLPHAQCCADGEHCCPTDYACDAKQGSCTKSGVVIPWYSKVPAQRSPVPSPDLPVVRCDSHMSCPTGSTCCRMSHGEWGCCPLPEAVCCADQEHCCPKGYGCDVRAGSCVKTIWLQVQSVPLTHISSPESQPGPSQHKDISCGGSYSCRTDQTCCKSSETTWGCCPSAKAVCCPDMKHCCPAGYTCSDEGTCSQSVGLNWDNWDLFFSKKKRALLV
ncbi:granulin a [Chanos chanos]|uniref:Granulin a n=1 Tax=Chanos chanos TaxID=29144 RepID=A0A6J2WPZ6_CHACN|nr:progranulin-like [Chanos chanos]